MVDCYQEIFYKVTFLFLSCTEEISFLKDSRQKGFRAGPLLGKLRFVFPQHVCSIKNDVASASM